MTKEECIKGLKYLSLAYGTDGFTPEECSVYYEFLQGYNYDTFRTAVKNIIRKSKFLPKITEILEECDNCKEHTKNAVLTFMANQGYFKSPIEYDKATTWIERNIIPNWFKEDMKKYHSMMNKEQLEYNQRLMIEN